MKILVIGASSFSGSHFCAYARNLGHEVIEQSLRNEFVYYGDVAVNFAALNVVNTSWQHPKEYFDINVLRNLSLFKRMEVLRYVHVSTPEVYGSTSVPVKEDHPFNPSTPYAVSRVAAENMARCYHAQYGFPVVFTRSCNVYGPGQQLYRLIPKLIVTILKGKHFNLEGSGISRRAFIHIDDLCAAIWRVMESGIPPEAYNITKKPMFYIRDIVAIVCRKMGVEYSDVVRYVEERPGKDSEYELDDSKIRSLGWQNYVSFEEGIEQTIGWINRNWETIKNEPTEYQIRL